MASVAGARIRPLRLLLVEDTASDVRLIKEALKGFSVPVDIIVASDGVEAMDLLRQAEVGLGERPDLVLLDWNLPRKNGREVLTEVKSSPALRAIPVLVMTSSDADEDIFQAYNLNANCYITKPRDLDDYMHVVRTIEQFWFLTASLPDAYQAHRATLSAGGAFSQ